MKSERAATRKVAGREHLATPVVVAVMTLGLIFQPVLPSIQVLAGAQSNGTGRAQSSQPAPSPGTGIISGVVVNENHEPVALAQVQVFSAPATAVQAQQDQTVPFSMRASGSASTDSGGRFQISGLQSGEYLVAVEAVPSLSSGATRQTPRYGTTFYPSTIDYQSAVRVSPRPDVFDPIQIQLVQVKGARVAGTVVSTSGRSASGMEVRLFHRFGDFGSEAPVAVVSDKGTFEIARVPPGWYRLTVAPRQLASDVQRSEFATRLIEVQGEDIDDLVLPLGTGASISGRVLAEPGASVQSAVGLRVNALPTDEEYASFEAIVATVASDWSFQMSGLSGSYQFTVVADRSPLVKATRITVDGVETASDIGVELTEGTHEVGVFIAPDEVPTPTVDKTLSSAALVEQFKSEKFFAQQFEIAAEIVARKDSSVLTSLVAWLSHQDRHVRGNAAFIFGGLGDPRGFQVITEILTDQSDRPPGVIAAGNWTLTAQIREDRYYAAHLLGDLRDPRAIPILVPLLKDSDVNWVVPSALAQVGGKSAVGPLLETLDDDDPSMRVLAIYALETLDAKEAIPHLISLLDDHRKSGFGARVSVAEAAKAAIGKLQ